MITQTPNRASHMQRRRISARRSSAHGKGLFALRPIAADSELFIDYALAIDGEPTDEIRRQYACRCYSPGCRRTMLGLSGG